MKLIKPLRLSVIPRFFEVGVQPHLVVTALGYAPLDAVDVLLGEQSLWQDFAAEARPQPRTMDAVPHVAASILDEGLPKARGEVLVRGFAHPPGGPAPGCKVRLVLGPEDAPLVDKTLVVSGDRQWDFMGMSMPTPFEKMPLDWEHAFGGPGHAPNPIGKGIASTQAPDGTAVQPLPNVEYPDQRIQAKGDRPRPASFAPLDPTHPTRLSRMGTFDRRWLETEYPGMPSDMHLEGHNTAPEDQRVEGWLTGGEPFLLEHMHPDRPRIEGRLPALRARAFYVKRDDASSTLHEVVMRLETVQFIPHRERVVLVWRGVAKTDEDDGYDISHLMVGAERIDEPRSLDHYRSVFTTRTDREQGALAALRDVDLLPPMPRHEGDEGPTGELQRLVAREGLLEKNLERRAAAAHERMKEELRAAGLDPVAFGVAAEPPRASPPPSVALDDVAATIAAAEQRERDEADEAERQRADAEERARALCEKHGLAYEDVVGKAVGGPPQFRAEDELAKLRAAVARAKEVGVPLPELEQRAHDPDYERSLRDHEVQQRELYRDGAHFMPAPRSVAPEEAKTLGGRVVAAHASRLALADQDLTGADLRGEDLEGADLSLAFLETARLEGARLAGANLRRAVLARADLRRADLRGADLTGANLGEADLTDADLSDARLDAAVLHKARLERTRLEGAHLVGTDVWSTELRDVVLARAELRKVNFVESKLERIDARGATLHEVTLLECSAPGLDLSDAKVEELGLVTVDAPGASFRGARVKKLSVLAGSKLPRADFTGAHMPGSSLRGADLEEARFDGAVLDGSDLSECNLRGANLDRAIMTGSMLVRSDLTGASVQKAKVTEVTAHKAKLFSARFDGSNLFQADLAGAKGDATTSFSGAILTRVRQTRKPT